MSVLSEEVAVVIGSLSGAALDISRRLATLSLADPAPAAARAAE